jgi:hypothetical protein
VVPAARSALGGATEADRRDEVAPSHTGCAREVTLSDLAAAAGSARPRARALIEHDNPEIRRVEEMAGFLGQLYNREVSEDDTVTVIRFSQIRI